MEDAAREYRRLTREIAAAKVNNADPMKKKVDLQPLYYARLNAADRMAALILSN